jgi:hypothetical protein
MKARKFTLFIVLLTVAFLETSAQSFYSYRRDRDFIVSIGSGTTNYFGEMVNPGSWGTTRPNIILGAEYHLSNRVALRGEFSWFQISGNDADANDDRKKRNLNFTSNNYELDVTGAVYLLPQGVRFYQRSKLNPYVFAGIGLLYMNPTTRDSQGNKHALQPLRTEGVSYSRFQPVIPFGGGVKLKVNPFFNVIVEAGYRLTFTDYLDDVSSQRYVDFSLVNGPVAEELSDRRVGDDRPVDNPATEVDERLTTGKRGNPEANDHYMMINLKIQYYLPYQVFNKVGQRKLYRNKRKGYYRRR